MEGGNKQLEIPYGTGRLLMIGINYHIPADTAHSGSKVLHST